jgi:hypothetical protein
MKEKAAHSPRNHDSWKNGQGRKKSIWLFTLFFWKIYPENALTLYEDPLVI